MMRTRLARKYGSNLAVEEYIDLAGSRKEMNCTLRTLIEAHKLYDQTKKPISDITAPMLACLMLYLASKTTGEYIPTREWTKKVCAYPTLLEHSKKFKIQ